MVLISTLPIIVLIKTFFMLDEQGKEQSLFGFSLPDYGVDNLRKAAKWARFTAIVAFCIFAIATIAFIAVFMVGDAMYSGAFRFGLGVDGQMGLFVTLVVMCAFIYSFYQLLRFSALSVKYAERDRATQLGDAFKSLRMFFLVMSIYILFSLIISFFTLLT
jgi:hypothetical protein